MSNSAWFRDEKLIFHFLTVKRLFKASMLCWMSWTFPQTCWLFLLTPRLLWFTDMFLSIFPKIETKWKQKSRHVWEDNRWDILCGICAPSAEPAVLQAALPWIRPIRDERCGCLWQPKNPRDSGQRGMDIDDVMGKRTHARTDTHMHTQSRAEQTTQWNNTQWVSACMIH